VWVSTTIQSDRQHNLPPLVTSKPKGSPCLRDRGSPLVQPNWKEMRIMANKYKTIIVADEDTMNLTIAKESLSDTYNIFTVPSGRTLFLLLECVKPHKILLDTKMSDMDGFTVFNMLKSSKKTAHIPVMILSEGIDPESEKKELDMGAIGYIRKPFSRETLSKQVKLHLPMA
jgi:response regulator RpfG family c-di-GMP phosphodiesterase